ncbi:uracil-DNA glycosylase [Longimicrobium sp.]|uniref:uracil-DNA glycosylase n=1 Tax=Longimicrobium sp. TaxID=2029185 RepID=UPI002E33C77D|nr:uracil-DNA glycosylase family protein [Longimicrobium sp.]HEX6042739.1 uracil-DNA glycosylase family protein [Longimicrobium sp.]
MTDDPRDLLRSYLRQRAELGEAELVLDRLSAAELQALLAEQKTAPAPRLVPPSDARREPAADPRRESAPDPRRESSPNPRRESGPPAEGPEKVEVHVRGGAPVPGTVPHPPSPRAPAAYVSAEEISSLPILADVREIALGCPRCGLARTRTHVVFGEGRENADVMVVGEAPGQDEDRSGRPFVGRAGRLLDLVLMSAGFPREDVYICNVLKCRPPQNRNPQPDEVSACSPYLLKQIELVQPRVILAFGTFAAQTLLGTDVSIGKLRGRTHQYQGVPLVPTYHPAACLRHPAWVRSVWEDVQRARDVLDAS